MKIQIFLISFLQVFALVCKNPLNDLFANFYSTPTPDLTLLVGDLHGDFQALIEILSYTNHSSSDLLISIGDVIGRGDYTKPLLHYFMSHLNTLHLIGNHEHLNLMGQFAYVSPGDIQSFGSEENRHKAFNKGGLYWEYLLSRPIIVKLGDLLLVHAGLSLRIAETYKDLEDINKNFWLDRELSGTFSPIWYRGYAQGVEKKVCEELERVLNIVNCKFMLMGHTVFQEIITKCAGKAIFVDTGISYAMFSRVSALEILQTGGKTVQMKAVYPKTSKIIYSAY